MTRSLLEYREEASREFGQPLFVYREYDYWRSRSVDWALATAAAPSLQPHHGGSKIRTIETMGLANYSSITMTCTPQSNQVRQMAAYMVAHRMSGELHVIVKPDAGCVDRGIVDRGNFAIARGLYSKTHVHLVPSAEDKPWFEALLAQHSGPGNFVMPRGGRSKTTVQAASGIGRDIAEGIESGVLPREILVLVVVGSGTTYAGINMGLADHPGATVLGLMTRPRAEQAFREMRAVSHGMSRAHLSTGYAPESGTCALGEKYAKAWAHRLGVEVNHDYCGRLPMWLSNMLGGDRGATECLVQRGEGLVRGRIPSRTSVPVVVVITGMHHTEHEEARVNHDTA